MARLILVWAVATAVGCKREPAVVGSVVAATFEVASDRALISAHGDGLLSATLVLTQWITGEETRVPVIFLADRGHGTSIDVGDLDAATPYRYVFAVNGTLVSPEYSFSTAPATGSRRGFSFAFLADIDTNPAFDSPIFRAMVDRGFDFFVSAGDWPYADGGPAPVDASGYRARHQEARRDPNMQPVLQRGPGFCIYDDHEVFNDWDGTARDEYGELIDSALAVWDEYFPLRTPPGQRYRSFRYGDLAQFIILDTRLFRSANDDPGGPQKTMLGQVQLDWLMASLRSSTAPVTFVVTSVPLDLGETAVGDDTWWSFGFERDLILSVIESEGLEGVIFLSADRHWFGAFDHSGLREFQFGPVHRGPELVPETVSGAVATSSQLNYGLITVEPDGPAGATVTVEAVDQDGATFHLETLSR